MQSISVIITAGGQGKRMGTKLAKQFLEINGRPILMTTIERLNKLLPAAKLIVVLPSKEIGFWQELCASKGFSVEHQVVEGGKERFHSVSNGLTHVHTDLVFIHDGVRPLVNQKTIQDLLSASNNNDAVIPVRTMVESMRKGSLTESKAVDRSQFFSVQTPQVFRSKKIQQAYRQQFSELFTDDASVAEAAGMTITMVPGNPENIKITQPQDLPLAEFLLKQLETDT